MNKELVKVKCELKEQLLEVDKLSHQLKESDMKKQKAESKRDQLKLELSKSQEHVTTMEVKLMVYEKIKGNSSGL